MLCQMCLRNIFSKYFANRLQMYEMEPTLQTFCKQYLKNCLQNILQNVCNTGSICIRLPSVCKVFAEYILQTNLANRLQREGIVCKMVAKCVQYWFHFHVCNLYVKNLQNISSKHTWQTDCKGMGLFVK